MALQPIARQSIPDEIFSQLAAQVLTGDRTPGDTLPSERALAEALGVSRTAVREALGRLERSGLDDACQCAAIHIAAVGEQ